MAVTSAATGLTPQQWDSKFFTEYVSASRFNKYMGKNENAMIQVKTDLTVKPGNKVTYAAVRSLANAGVTGNTTLKGNEESLDSRSMAITVDVLRHAVTMTAWEEQKSAIALRDAARTQLKTWAMDTLRNDLVAAMGNINGVAHASATEAQKDAWLVDNADRTMFGDTLDNNDGADHSASLGVIASTEIFDTGQASIAKRFASQANPRIKPIRVEGSEGEQEWYIWWANTYSFRDMQASLAQTNREARPRDVMSNPLFNSGDLLWDGMIIKELPEIASLGAVGASSAVIRPNYLCGAQALGLAWAQRTKTTVDVDDFDFQHGVGIQEIRGVDKLVFGSGATDTADLKDNGILTLYSASAADT
ncbi:MAG: DUF4043 family protein [Nitrospirota bacterium]|nr:DUF4043 family protein [Gammaproteobacteria bacterium]MDH5527192.1 DUF4043 family protein [Nitrospirota bacterium]